MNRNHSFLAMESLVGLCRKLSDHTGTNKIETEQYGIYQAFAEPFWYCRTHIWNNDPGQEKALSQSLARLYKEGKAPPLLSFTEEEVTPALPEFLQAAGFAPYGVDAGMLMVLPSDYSCKDDPNIVRIGPNRIGEWAQTCSTAFGKLPVAKIMRILIQDPACLFYGYLQDGAIIATLMMSLQPGNAGIHEVGTLQAYRGHGFCKALLARSFADAARLGYPLISLQATKYGEPVYRSMGMQVASHVIAYKYEE